MLNKNRHRVGMMQGRLSPIRNGRIQSFPHENWRIEIAEAAQLNIQKIEWTIDSEEFFSNPLVSPSGGNEINSTINEWKIRVPSVTCDYFMENPPWLGGEEAVQANLKSIINGMHQIDSEILVIPLVDNSSIKYSSYSYYVVDYFK